jgi:hypothetical protein
MTEIIEITQVWQDFQELVVTMQQLFQAAPSPTNLQTNQTYEAIETYFQRQIMATTTAPLPPTVAGKIRSYTTEIHRLLKLGQRDLMFWQSARQLSTKKQRQADMESKLVMIRQFIVAMLEELSAIER